MVGGDGDRAPLAVAGRRFESLLHHVGPRPAAKQSFRLAQTAGAMGGDADRLQREVEGDARRRAMLAQAPPAPGDAVLVERTTDVVTGTDGDEAHARRNGPRLTTAGNGGISGVALQGEPALIHRAVGGELPRPALPPAPRDRVEVGAAGVSLPRPDRREAHVTGDGYGKAGAIAGDDRVAALPRGARRAE